MKKIATLLKFFKSPYAKRMLALCHPLKQALGIDTVWYSAIGAKGEFAHVSNTPENTRHYFENEGFLNNPFLRHPRNFSEGFYHLSDVAETTYLDSQKKHNETFGIDHLLFLSKKQKTKCHIFGFASTQKNLPLPTIYLNHSSLLDQFTDHFLEEVGTYSMEPFQVELPALVGSSFFADNKVLQDSMSNFVTSLGYQKLSAREKECLVWFLKGKTAQQTADFLNLSRRTVETYFENIKDKLGCYSKAEILQSFFRN